MSDSYEQLVDAFVTIANTLVADYDVIELAQQLVDKSMMLLPIAAAGLLIRDAQGDLQVIASSSEETRLLEVFQLKADAGPCLLAFRSGNQVLVDDLSVDHQRWPRFAERAADYNFRSVSALPLRLRAERLGALNLFGTQVGVLSSTHLAIGQALADVATIGILTQRTLARSELINQQLQIALNTRVTVEQAKGVLAERGNVDMERAFHLLRSYARRHRQGIADVARLVVEGKNTSAILEPDQQ